MPWEVGQRLPQFSSFYISPALPSLFSLDVVVPTQKRHDLLTQASELGDPRLPVWSSGSGRSATPFTPPIFLNMLYDMITAPVLSLPITQHEYCCGIYDMSTTFLSPRKAFLLETGDPLVPVLTWNNTDPLTLTAFSNSVRRAYSSWDFLTAFDPVFLPLSDENALLFRNLDPIVQSTANTSDDASVVIGGPSLSDSVYIPSANASKPSPTGLDYSSGRLSAGGNVASFLA